jgi:hypothetical protein
MAHEIVLLRFPFQVPVSEIPALVQDFRRPDLVDAGVSLVISYPESPPPSGAGMLPNPRRGGPWVFVSVQTPGEDLEQVQKRFDEVVAEFEQ